MSGTPPRNPDRLNVIGVVVVGICGAVLIYVSIVALQAFYMNNSSDIRTMADYGGSDITQRTLRTSQQGAISEYGANAAQPGAVATYRIAIDKAMAAVVNDAKADPALLVPMVGRSDTATAQPIYGRPKLIPVAPPVDGTGAGSADPGAGSADPGAGSADPGAGSAATPAPATPAPATPAPAAPAAPKGDAPAN